MTVHAVVFDLDGILLDTMTSVPRAYVETIRDLGGPDLTLGAIAEKQQRLSVRSGNVS